MNRRFSSFAVPFFAVALSAFALSAFGLVSSARGALIDVDFNTGSSPTQTGAAVIGNAGDVWNGAIPGASGQALDNSFGVNSGVTMDVNAAASFDSQATTDPFIGQTYDPLMRDFLFNFGGPNTVTLHGVAAGTYDLYVYSAGDAPSNNTAPQQRISDFNANGSLGVVGPNNSNSALLDGANYTIIPVTVTGSGLLTITVSTGVPGDTGQFNGFQLTPAPEPSSIVALVGLGMAGLVVAIRRRRSKS